MKRKLAETYIKQPKEAEVAGKLWHLQKYVYGLNDASLYGYEKSRESC